MKEGESWFLRWGNVTTVLKQKFELPGEIMDQYIFKIRDAVVAAEEELSLHFLICFFI